MIRFVTILLAVSVLGMNQSLESAEKKITEKIVEIKAEKGDFILCGHCGHVKGSEACCAKDAEVCGCGAHKGSPGCCLIKKAGKDVILCGNCGQAKGSDFCCDDKAKKCKSCGRAKGSPGCCLVGAKTASEVKTVLPKAKIPIDR